MSEARATNPLVDQFRKGGVPKELRLMAAQGALPLKPEDLVELLTDLTSRRRQRRCSGGPASPLAELSRGRAPPHPQEPRDPGLGAHLGRDLPRRARAPRGRAAEHLAPGRDHRGLVPRAARGARRARRHQPDAPPPPHHPARGARDQPEPQQGPAPPPARAARDLPHRRAADRGARGPAASAAAASAAPEVAEPEVEDVGRYLLTEDEAIVRYLSDDERKRRRRRSARSRSSIG